MAQTILMPKLGQTVEECTIVSWHKHEGDKVSKGEVLFEVETDKGVLEAESFFEGTLLKVFVAEGETVPVQAVVGYIGKPGEEVPAAPPPPPKKAAEPEAVKPEQVAAAGTETVSALAVPAAVPAAKAAAAYPARARISPRARRLAREKLIDTGEVRGTGPGGRGDISTDVTQYCKRKLRYSMLTRAGLHHCGQQCTALPVPGADDAPRMGQAGAEAAAVRSGIKLCRCEMPTLRHYNRLRPCSYYR